MKTIFVQIASYRDPELVPTIKDCISKAKYPDRLTFGICWQNAPDEEDVRGFLEKTPRLKYIDVPHTESEGLCWARSLIQQLWDGEDYTLQLDSHHRFVPGWDVELEEMMKLTESPKPLLSSYCDSYYPTEPERKVLSRPLLMTAAEFTQHGTIRFQPVPIPDFEKLEKPVRARFVSGHFFFTLGEHCKEYRYDPYIYFAGDEISLSIRSYTLGYDLFHPHKHLIWHEYSRKYRVKHWDDFSGKNKEEGVVKKTWSEIDGPGLKRLRQMLREEDNGLDLGEYDLGEARSHRDYEIYAGLKFSDRMIHPDTVSQKEPPVNDRSEWWNRLVEYKLDLKIPKMEGDFKFIYVGIEDSGGNVLHRVDLASYHRKIAVEFATNKTPKKYVVWRYTPENQWAERHDIEIPRS